MARETSRELLREIPREIPRESLKTGAYASLSDQKAHDDTALYTHSALTGQRNYLIHISIMMKNS